MSAEKNNSLRIPTPERVVANGCDGLRLEVDVAEVKGMRRSVIVSSSGMWVHHTPEVLEIVPERRKPRRYNEKEWLAPQRLGRKAVKLTYVNFLEPYIPEIDLNNCIDTTLHAATRESFRGKNLLIGKLGVSTYERTTYPDATGRTIFLSRIAVTRAFIHTIGTEVVIVGSELSGATLAVHDANFHRQNTVMPERMAPVLMAQKCLEGCLGQFEAQRKIFTPRSLQTQSALSAQASRAQRPRR